MRGRKTRTAADVELARATALARIRGEVVPNPPQGLAKRPKTMSPWRGQRAAMGPWKERSSS